MKSLNKNLRYVFDPKSTAIIGASPNPGSIGNVIMKNLVEGKYAGKIYPVNPKYDEVMGFKCVSKITQIKGRIECVVISIPAQAVPEVLRQAAKKGAKGAVIISGGFSEAGRTDLENQIRAIALRHNIALVGPNCIGVYNPYTGVDSGFNPPYKSGRPGKGRIALISQSGAVGACITDVAAKYGIGISKFVSYGNAAALNESDYLEYLSDDKKTDSIVLYIEGTKNGRKLFETLDRINHRKPVVVMKAGRYGKAAEAAKSHTGNIAGNYLAYHAAFRQARVTEAEDLEEIFDFIRVFEQPLPNGKRIAIVTNGGGMGVLSADMVEQNKMEFCEFGAKTCKQLKKILPWYASVRNPLDLVGDARVELYSKVISI